MAYKTLKPKYWLIVSCILTMSICLIQLRKTNVNQPKSKTQLLPPNPVDPIKQKDKHLDRTEFIEQMHRAAPDIDWKRMDAQTRKEKFLKKQNLIKSGNHLKSGTTGNFADGNIIGAWHERGSNNLAGRMMVTDFDHETENIYCASAGGIIWKSDLSGSFWQPLNDRIRYNDVKSLRVIKQNNTTRILVFHKDKYHNFVSYSDDEGETWNDTNGLDIVKEWGTIKRGIVLNDEYNTVYILAGEWDWTNWKAISVLYKSVDGGKNFVHECTIHEGNTDLLDIWSDYYTNTGLYVLVKTNLYKVDQGELQYVSNTNVSSGYNNVLIDGRLSNNTITFYASYSGFSTNNTRFYRSTNGGTSWEKRGNSDHGPFSSNSLELSVKNMDLVYWGTSICFHSQNGGNTWSDFGKYQYPHSPSTDLHQDIPGINSFIDKEGNEFTILSTDGGTYITYDNLQTVNNISLSGQNVSQYYSLYTSERNPDIIYAGSQDQGFQRSKTENNGVREFDLIWTGDYGSLVSADKGKTVWAFYPGTAYIFTDPENSGFGQSITGWSFQGGGYVWIPPTCPLPQEEGVESNRVYIGGGNLNNNGDAHLIELEYTGSNITSKELPFNFRTNQEISDGVQSKISAIAISEVNHNYRFVLSSTGNFFYTTNNATWGRTYNFTGPTPNHMYGTCVLPSPVSKERVYISGSGYSNSPVYVSDDHGKTFRPINNGLPNTLVFELDCNADESLVFAATEVGPYVYIPSEDKWYELDDLNSPDQVYWCVEYIEEINVARFGTYGRGIWDFNVEQNLVSSDLVDKASDLKVIKAYPNPCKEYLNLELQLASSSEINISVLDIQGKKLASDIKQYLTAGKNQVRIDMIEIPPGICFIHISTNYGTIINKILKAE